MNIFLAIMFRLFPTLKLYEIPIRICAWITAALLTVGAASYTYHVVWTRGYDTRSTEVEAEKAKEVSVAVVADKQQTEVINEVAEEFQGDKHEIEAAKPVVRVVVKRVCDHSTSAPGPPGMPTGEISSGPDGPEAAPDPEDTALGEAFAEDAGNYPLCFAALQRLREIVVKSSGAHHE